MGNLIERNVDDENFAHCIGLLGPMAAWAEELEPGHVISHDDLNMISVPVEVALALLHGRLNEESNIGEGAKKCFELLAMFRAVRSGRAKVKRKAAKKRKTKADIFAGEEGHPEHGECHQ